MPRREHEKVVVKPWPRCQDLDVWRSGTDHAVYVASGYPDIRAWQDCLDPAQKSHLDYELLADSGDFRFQSIDSKLSAALQNMVENAGEVTSEVKIRIRQRSQELGKKGNFLMGREIFAMMPHRRMKHGSMPVISTSYSTVGIRRCIISSTPGWKSSPT